VSIRWSTHFQNRERTSRWPIDSGCTFGRTLFWLGLSNADEK
jgi:hypothetical protein